MQATRVNSRSSCQLMTWSRVLDIAVTTTLPAVNSPTSLQSHLSLSYLSVCPSHLYYLYLYRRILT